MGFMNIFNQIIILFLLMIVGYGSQKLDIIKEELYKGLSHLVFQVALPALIIKSMQYSFSKEMLLTSFKMILLSLVVHGIAFLVSCFVPKLLGVKGSEADVIQFILIFSNVGYMGYPVLNAVYGEQGVFYGALFNIPFNLLLWTLGYGIMTRHSSGGKEKVPIKKVLLNPGVFSVIIGFVLFLFSIKLPTVLYGTLHYLGEMTVPLSMLVIGAMLAELPLKEIFNEGKLIVVSSFRLIIIPLVVMGILWMMGLRGITLGVPVIIAGMPAAANTAIFGNMFNTAPYLASKGVFITTLFSIISIPLLSLLL